MSWVKAFGKLMLFLIVYFGMGAALAGSTYLLITKVSVIVGVGFIIVLVLGLLTWVIRDMDKS